MISPAYRGIKSVPKIPSSSLPAIHTSCRARSPSTFNSKALLPRNCFALPSAKIIRFSTFSSTGRLSAPIFSITAGFKIYTDIRSSIHLFSSPVLLTLKRQPRDQKKRRLWGRKWYPLGNSYRRCIVLADLYFHAE